MNRKTALLTAGICAAAIFCVSCGKPKDGAAGSSTAVKAPAETVYAVNAWTAVRENLSDYLEFGGDVTAESSVDMYADVAGKVSVIQAAVGDTVEKGDILLYVDPARPGMTYSISPVKAPISGTVVSLPVPVGTMVSQSVSLGKISDTDKLEIKISVPERFISKIADGQNAFLRFDAYPGEVFPAKVIRISPVLDTSSRTMQTTLSLTTPNPKIKAGMFARVKLITDRRLNVITVPYAAIVSRQGERFVFVADEKDGVFSARRVPVSAGIRVDDMIEITGGISENELVIVKGQSLLSDGAKLNIISRAGGNQ